MTWRNLFTDPRYLATLLALAVGVTWLVQGEAAAQSMALAIIPAAIGMVGVWWVVKFLGRVFSGEPHHMLESAMGFTLALFKFPALFLAFRYAAHKEAFLIGIVLVYSLAVGWAQARTAS